MAYCWNEDITKGSRPDIMDDAQLRTVWQQRQFPERATHLSGPLSILMNRKLAKRVRQLSKLAAVWDEMVPQGIRDHTALEGFHDGILTVVVDSSSHRFKLQTLLAGGLMREIQTRLPQPINKVRLVPGQFFSVDVSGAPRYEL